MFLSPYCPHDCVIDLLPRSSPLQGHLYSLSEPKRKAMEMCNNSLLQASFVCLELAPMGHYFHQTRNVQQYHLICRTAFSTPTEQYKYLIMPFGLLNAPAILQTQMNNVLCLICNWHVFIYLDDILIFSHHREQHIHHAWSLFQHLLKNSL